MLRQNSVKGIKNKLETLYFARPRRLEPELNVAGFKLSVIGVFERAGCINNHTPFKAQRHPLESKTSLRIPNEKLSQYLQICCLFKKIKHFFLKKLENMISINSNIVVAC
ncbi:hypothetical protein CWI38_1101p0030 [Hamiltosporidium tvaerminnensis]|uniref:Uncharacterized protein n=1 Tax=Hamiltosporidium tvaerminnensis TaxID=1176355 RepID=A0A4Q9LST2_9MICR|nr:hypothetical protein CWI38_1101p0030 [Hamiltosporidium tvaerminnensis]